MRGARFAIAALAAALTVPAYAGTPPDSRPVEVPQKRSPARRPGLNSPVTPHAAEAAPVLSADVLILHATNDKKGLDSRIGPLPELAKAPFSNYDSYQVLDHARLPLKKNDAQNLKLPNGRTLQVSLLDEPGHDAVRLSASINRPNGSEFLPLLEVKAHVGQAFIVAGQSYKKGILVLVIRVVK